MLLLKERQENTHACLWKKDLSLTWPVFGLSLCVFFFLDVPELHLRHLTINSECGCESCVAHWSCSHPTGLDQTLAAPWVRKEIKSIGKTPLDAGIFIYSSLQQVCRRQTFPSGQLFSTCIGKEMHFKGLLVCIWCSVPCDLYVQCSCPGLQPLLSWVPREGQALPVGHLLQGFMRGEVADSNATYFCCRFQLLQRDEARVREQTLILP